MTTPNPTAFYLRRWNHAFEAPEYASKNGVDWTLHLEKAQAFETFDRACRSLVWFPDAGACGGEEVARQERLVAEQAAR